MGRGGDTTDGEEEGGREGMAAGEEVRNDCKNLLLSIWYASHRARADDGPAQSVGVAQDKNA